MRAHSSRPASPTDPCGSLEGTCAYAAGALDDGDAAAARIHIETCAACRRELESLTATIGRFVAWPTDVLRPSASLRQRLAERIAQEAGTAPEGVPPRRWREPGWREAAPGLRCKLLAQDADRGRTTMLARLAAGATCPLRVQSEVEELHLLEGELWAGRRKLLPGDYSFGLPADRDHLVWSETGCTCLIITSTKDVLS